MIAAALEAEVAAYVERFAGGVDEEARPLVVRNGRARAQADGRLGHRADPLAKVNDRRVDPATGERQKFSSKILPAYARRSPKVTEVQHDHRAPDEFRDQLRNLTPKWLLRTCAPWRPDRLAFRDPATATKIACKLLATRLFELDDEIAALIERSSTSSPRACSSARASGPTTPASCSSPPARTPTA